MKIKECRAHEDACIYYPTKGSSFSAVFGARGQANDEAAELLNHTNVEGVFKSCGSVNIIEISPEEMLLIFVFKGLQNRCELVTPGRLQLCKTRLSEDMGA